MEVIILAGGQGSRMETALPKALVEINQKPIIAYQLDFLLNSGIVNKVVLALGYEAEKIKDYVLNKYPKANIVFSIETQPLGTAGALKQAMAQCLEDFTLILNCDDITDIDLELLQQGENDQICVAHPELPFGLVKEADGYAVFEEKPRLKEWVSCGWYYLEKNNLNQLLPGQGSLEYDVFPSLKLLLFKHEGFWQPLNTPKDIKNFEAKTKK